MFTGLRYRSLAFLALFSIIFSTFYIIADEDLSDEEVMQEEIIDKEGPEPTYDGPSLTDYMNSGIPRVHDAVSIISGAWVDNACHAVDTSTVDPYKVGHVYSSKSMQEGSLADGWEFFHPSKIVIFRDGKPSRPVKFYIYEAGGATFTFESKDRYKCNFKPVIKNVGYTFASSIASPNRLSPFNTHINWNNKDGVVTLTLGDSTIRRYEKYKEENEPEAILECGYWGYDEYTFRLLEEKTPNNIIKTYKYNKKKKDELKSITTSLSNGEVIGKVSFEHESDKVVAKLSSGRKVIFNLKALKDKSEGEYKDCITSIHPEGGKEIVFSYDHTSKKHIARVERKKLSDGNALVAKFYDTHTCKVDGVTCKPEDQGKNFKYFVNNRVRELYAKSLPGEKEPSLSHAFYYKKLGDDYAYAIVKEKDGYSTKYLWNTKSDRIRWMIKERSDGKRLRYERFIWGTEKEQEGRLLARILFDENKKPILIKEWKYDSRGLVTKETLRGKFTSQDISDLVIDKESYWWKSGGEELIWRASYDDKGRKISESDPDGSWIEYTYVPDGRDLLQKKLVFSRSGKIIKRSFYAYDPIAPLCLEEVTDDGADRNSESFNGVTSRTIKRYTYRRQMPYWGGVLSESTSIWTPQWGENLIERKEFIRDDKGRVVEERLFGSDGVLAKTARMEYDRFDRVTAVRYPDGSYETKAYDEKTGRLIRTTSPKGSVVFTYDHNDRIIREDVSFQDGSSFTKHTSYDLFGRHTTTVDERGRTAEVQKDSIERKVFEVMPAAIIDGKIIKPRITYAYEGLKVIKTLPHGAKESILLSSWNKPFETISAIGAKTTFRYDSVGREVYRSDNQGFITLTDYDDQGRDVCVREVVDGVGERHILEKRYEGSRLVEEITPGIIKRYTYDRHDRKSREETIDRVTGLSSAVSYTYDALGRVVETVDEAKRLVSTQSYDVMDRVVETTLKSLDDPSLLRSHTRSKYDLLGNIIEKGVLLESNGAEAVTTYTYGRYNTLRSVTDAEGRTTFFETTLQEKGEGGLPYLVVTTIYPDGTSNQVWKDGFDATTLTQTFDPLRRVISKRATYVNILGKAARVIDTPFDPATGEIKGVPSVTSFEYDSLGNCVALHKGTETEVLRTWRYRYDLHSRKTHEVKPSGVELLSSYDSKGRLSSYSSSDGSIHYQYHYNELDLPIQVTDHITAQSIERRYNGFGLLLQEILPDGVDINYEINNAGETTALSSSCFNPVTYSYQAGVLKQVEYNGYAFTYTQRTCQGQPLEMAASGGAIVSCTYDSLLRRRSFTFKQHKDNSPYFEEKRVDFDVMGRLLRRDLILPTLSQPQVDTYRFDYLGQLTNENEELYQFDSLHRATHFKGKDHRYNVLHELEGDDFISFDIDGRRVTDTNGKVLAYDALDRLTSVTIGSTTVSYSYDAFHRRTKRIVTKDSSPTLIERFLFVGENEVGSLEGEEKTLASFRVLGEGLGAEIGASLLIEINNKAYIPIHDLSGHMRILLNANTYELEESLDYTAFGPKDHPSFVITPWTFSSKRSDPITGYIFFGRRYYDPATLTWLTLDPLGFDAGPNLYAYVKNSPLTNIDLYGLFGESSDGRSFFSRAWDWISDTCSSCWDRLSSWCSSWGSSERSNSEPSANVSPEPTPTFEEFLATETLMLEGQEIKKGQYYKSGMYFATREGYTKAEWLQRNRGRTFIRGSIIKLGNGMQKTLHEVKAEVDYLLSKFKNIVAVIILYNSTDSFVEDVGEAGRNVLKVKTEVVETLKSELTDFLMQCRENGVSFKADWICHSQGAAIANCILSANVKIIEQYTDRIATFGGAAMINGAENYIAIGDPVPYLNILSFLGAAFRGFSDVHYLPFRLQTPFQAHAFVGPSYQQAIENFILRK